MLENAAWDRLECASVVRAVTKHRRNGGLDCHGWQVLRSLLATARPIQCTVQTPTFSVSCRFLRNFASGKPELIQLWLSLFAFWWDRFFGSLLGFFWLRCRLGGRGFFALRPPVALRSDSQPVECLPQGRERFIWVTVEDAAENTEEDPSAPFKLALSFHVGIVAIWAVPFVAIAFHGHTPAKPFCNEVYSVPRNFKLRQDPVITSNDPKIDIDLKPTVKGTWWVRVLAFNGIFRQALKCREFDINSL